jgi:hypothetical protein
MIRFAFQVLLTPNDRLCAEIISDGKKSKPTGANDDVLCSPVTVRFC